MGWSNRQGSGMQTFRQWKADRAPKKASTNKPRATALPRVRELGMPLDAADVPGLVAQALASGGPIAHGDVFEHLLVVSEFERYVFMHHFLVAAPITAGGPQRIVMLTDRVLSMFQNYPSPVEEFTQQLLDYASGLDAPARWLIGSPGVVHVLSFTLRSTVNWVMARGFEAQLCTGPYARYGNIETIGHAMYLQALGAKSVMHPDFAALNTRMRRAQLVPQGNPDGPLVVPRSNVDLGMDGRALCMAYVAEPMSQLPGALQSYRK